VRTRWADEDAGGLAAALEDLASPLLFGGVPALVLRRAEALPGAAESWVLDTIARLSPPSCLILVARGLDGRRTLRTTFERAGGAVACGRVTDPRALREWGERLARERGHAIRPAALDLLLDRTTLDLAGLDSEIEKASLYAGAGVPIAREHVEAVGAVGHAAAVEELADRLARGDRAGAHRAAAALLRAGEPPVRIVAFLAASLRRALHVAELRDQGLDDDAVAGRLGMPGWLVRRFGRGRSAEALERALETLRDLDLDLKRSRPPGVAFDAALAGLSAPTPPRRS
jgi:DNA polymerase III delta subunit